MEKLSEVQYWLSIEFCSLNWELRTRCKQTINHLCFNTTDLIQSRSHAMREIKVVFNVQPLKVDLLLDFNFECKFYCLEKHKNAHGKFIFHFGYRYVCFVHFFFFRRRPFMVETHTIIYYCILVHTPATFCSIFRSRPYFAHNFCRSYRHCKEGLRLYRIIEKY